MKWEEGGIFISVELARLCASSRKCCSDSIRERKGERETSKKASTARGHLGRKEKTTARNRMEPCWSSTLPRKIAIRACTITSQIKVIFTSLHLELKGNGLSVFQTQIDSEMNYWKFAPKNFSAEGAQLRWGSNKYQWQSGFHTAAALAARYNLISNYRNAQHPNLKH